jgi:16S rRNA (guanine527-N7)-methyltransferase
MGYEEKIAAFSSFYQVSRETILSLKKYEDLLVKENNNLNLIGKSTINKIWTRHFLDSFQVIDFIDRNDNVLLDLGSGAGFPGLVLGIAAKENKIPLKIKIVEKSPKKIMFLKKVSKKLNLNVEFIARNILTEPVTLDADVIVARAFKPLQVILKLIHSTAKNWRKTFIFQGKTGASELLQASKSWDIKYKQRASITNNDSFVMEINKLKKK